MATYQELFNLRGDGELRGKITIAITVAIDTIRTETSSTNGHATRITWAEKALGELDLEASKTLMVLLAANKGLTVAQIKGASDSSIQGNVDSVVNILAGVPNV